MDRLLVTPEEASEILSIGRTTVYSLMATRRLESVTIGRSRRVPYQALERFVAQLGGLGEGELSQRARTVTGVEPVASPSPEGGPAH